MNNNYIIDIFENGDSNYVSNLCDKLVGFHPFEKYQLDKYYIFDYNTNNLINVYNILGYNQITNYSRVIDNTIYGINLLKIKK